MVLINFKNNTHRHSKYRPPESATLIQLSTVLHVFYITIHYICKCTSDFALYTKTNLWTRMLQYAH